MAESVSPKKEEVRIPTRAKGTRKGISRKTGARILEMSVNRSSAEEAVRYESSKASSVYKGSEKYFEHSCNPCSTAGDHVEAEGFCTNCEDYLCGTCLKSHSRSKTSLHHSLLDKDKMPKKYKVCDPCKTAGDEEKAAGYCTDCGDYLCSDCFRSHSRSKTSRQHVLLDKDNMPGRTDSALASSVAKMNISGGDDDTQQYNEENTYNRDINVKANEDEEDCYITDMTLVTCTDLILSDHDNKSLKLFDLENNVIKYSLKLQTYPGGLTTISQYQVAVVLGNECKIQIVSVSGGLSVERTLNTNGECVDIMYINKKIYVSFWEPVKFQILELTGAVYKTIRPSSEVLKHCTLPRYIAIGPDESVIYISDWEANKVMCMDMNGGMISMYQGELDEPNDITISPTGFVYLCDKYMHVVYKMTSDLSDITVILGQEHGLSFPNAMCFSADKQQLYISNADNKDCNFIKKYELK